MCNLKCNKNKQAEDLNRNNFWCSHWCYNNYTIFRFLYIIIVRCNIGLGNDTSLREKHHRQDLLESLQNSLHNLSLNIFCET